MNGLNRTEKAAIPLLESDDKHGSLARYDNNQPSDNLPFSSLPKLPDDIWWHISENILTDEKDRSALRTVNRYFYGKKLSPYRITWALKMISSCHFEHDLYEFPNKVPRRFQPINPRQADDRICCLENAKFFSQSLFLTLVATLYCPIAACDANGTLLINILRPFLRDNVQAGDLDFYNEESICCLCVFPGTNICLPICTALWCITANTGIMCAYTCGSAKDMCLFFTRNQDRMNWEQIDGPNQQIMEEKNIP